MSGTVATGASGQAASSLPAHAERGPRRCQRRGGRARTSRPPQGRTERSSCAACPIGSRSLAVSGIWRVGNARADRRLTDRRDRALCRRERVDGGTGKPGAGHRQPGAARREGRQRELRRAVARRRHDDRPGSRGHSHHQRISRAGTAGRHRRGAHPRERVPRRRYADCHQPHGAADRARSRLAVGVVSDLGGACPEPRRSSSAARSSP